MVEKNQTVNPPQSPTGPTSIWGLQHTFKGFKFKQDEEGYIEAIPSVTFDPARMVPATVGNFQPGTDQAVGYYRALADSLQWLYNPATSLLESQRTPTKFVTVNNVSAAGNTIIWDPAAGKKFNLMGFQVLYSKEAACAGAHTILLSDEAAAFWRLDFSSAALVATGNIVAINVNYPGNGLHSAAADNILYLTISGALTAGKITVNAWGTEE